MRNLIAPLLAGMAVVMLAGCAGVQRMTPATPGLVNINLPKADYTVLASVKGSSARKSYVCGLVQVTDGTKVRVLGIKFFKEQYSYLRSTEISLRDALFLPLPYLIPYLIDSKAYRQRGVSAEDRAYQKVLAAAPEADVVIEPAVVVQRSGFPLIYLDEEVTVTGKAIKYKAD